MNRRAMFAAIGAALVGTRVAKTTPRQVFVPLFQYENEVDEDGDVLFAHAYDASPLLDAAMAATASHRRSLCYRQVPVV